jgi:hypothetical protein
MDTRQAAFGLLLLLPIHPNLKSLELCGAIVVSNDGFLVIPASFSLSVQFWFGFASNVPVLVIGIRFMGGAGDESDDCLPKHIRVRSIASVYGNVSQPIEGALQI